MKLYPNPVVDELYIRWPSSGNSILVIYQADGKQVDRLSTLHGEASFDVDGYAAGQYLLFIKTNEMSYQARFIKD